MDETKANHKPHIIVLAYHGQGHINPMVQFSKRLAAKGIKITITTTLQHQCHEMFVVDGFEAFGSRKLVQLVSSQDSENPVRCLGYDANVPWASRVANELGIVGLKTYMSEFVTKQALFPGDSELQQLLHIFRLLGTPNEEIWRGVSKLKDWHEYPQWSPKPLYTAVPGFDEYGLNLLAEMLHYDPSRRISAKKAMEHPYFDDVDKSHL